MPDSSIPETGDKKPVLVEFDGANPIKYLNIKCYPKDGIKPPLLPTNEKSPQCQSYHQDNRMTAPFPLRYLADNL